MKPPLHVIGMFGIGDNLHQRAVIVRLMETHEVWLETCHVWLYLDLLERGGLHLILRPTTLWMHVQNIRTEQALHPGVYDNRPPANAQQIRIWYYKKEIDHTGSMLATMHLAAGLDCVRPDFTLPMRPEWNTDRVQRIVSIARASGKPVMIYRPIVLRREWDSHLRNPDPQHYTDIYHAVRDDFYVISIASLAKDHKGAIEWIVGGEQPADLKIHDGSLQMWEMASLFDQADVVFCNAGMAPVLAQAVRTPAVVVYGGRESFRTSQRAGAHLSPTLGIDPINPCDCHSHTHNCDKRIDVEAALPRVREFLKEHVHANPSVRHHLRGHAGEAGVAADVV